MNCIAKNSKEITIMNTMKKIITRITTLFVLCMMVASQSAYAIESVTFFHHDALGSTIAATDESGNLLWTEEYKPYGGRLKRDSASAENNTWYTGKQEGAYGLTYFGARWYDNEVGRFMAIDPVGFDASNIQSFNRYAYANNNPFRFIDPDGRDAAEAERLVNGLRSSGNRHEITNNLIIDAKVVVEVSDAVGSEGQLIDAIPGVLGIKMLSKSGRIIKSLNGIPFKEAKKLMSKWDKSSYSTVSNSIRDHAKRHGYGDDILKYLRKAENFNKKGAKKKILENGATRWNRKSGEFLIERKGKIVSYGKN